MSITVIDAPCGAGKTTWAIQEMDSHPEQAYIYCTPFLPEIKRIKETSQTHHFWEPENYDSTKIADFNRLLADKRDIAVTHQTFLNATQETLGLISEGDYHLIIDEALDVISEFNNIDSVEKDRTQMIKPGDIKFLLDNIHITVEDSCKVSWNGAVYAQGKFEELARLCSLGRVYLARGKLMVCIFPPEMFQLFDEIYFLTYLFEGSVPDLYFKMFGIDWNLASVKLDGDRQVVTEYDPTIDLAFRTEARGLITLCNSSRLNESRVNYSSTWYKNHAPKEQNRGKDKSPELQEIRGHLNTFFKNIAVLDGMKANATNNDIMWTCPKDYKNDLKGKGYTCVRRLTSDELEGLTKEEREKLEKDVDCWVPCNAKATNDYADRWALAYCCDLSLNPMLAGLFADHGLKFSQDKFALSALIQWIWRSRIRKGEAIYLYLPSRRIRKLFREWLGLPPEVKAIKGMSL